MAGGKAVHDAVNERLRAALRALMAANKWDQTQVGKVLDVKQQAISSFLKRDTGASLHLAWGIARSSNISLDTLLSGRPTTLAPPWRDLPGWNDAVAEARKLFPRVSDDAWSWLGSLSGPTIPGLAPVALGMMAGGWDQVDHAHETVPAKTAVRPKKGAK